MKRGIRGMSPWGGPCGPRRVWARGRRDGGIRDSSWTGGAFASADARDVLIHAGALGRGILG